MAVFKTTNSGISGSSPYKNSMIGKWETPIRMIIQNESDICAKNDDLAKTLFQIANSKHFGESFVARDEFDVFTPVAEGGSAPQDAYADKYSKFIEHTTFKKQFRITLEMMEDSLTSQMELKARKFVRAYYRTRNLFASTLLTGAVNLATATSGNINHVAFGPAGATQLFDISAADGKALFSAASARADKNRFHYVLGSGVKIDTALVENVLAALVSKIRNMKDENGLAMGYTADTIVIPSDDPALEAAVKKVLGSEFGNGQGGLLSGSINLNYGNWTLVVDPLWQRSESTSHPMIVFSSRARDNLSGAIFLNRKPLTITAHVDQDTDDYIWNGIARHSAGFVSHKWAALVDILDYNTTDLYNGGTILTTSGNTPDESAALSL